MDKQKVISFAKEQGYDKVIPHDKWRGYDVYEPAFDNVDEKNPPMVGMLRLILIKDGRIRMSTPEEAFEWMDDQPDDE